jgi:hypothetical protein
MVTIEDDNYSSFRDAMRRIQFLRGAYSNPLAVRNNS